MWPSGAVGRRLILVFSVRLWLAAGAGYYRIFTGKVNERIVLPCTNVTEQTTWMKANTSEPVLACGFQNSSDGHFFRVNGTALEIRNVTIQDEGNYICSKCSKGAAEDYIQLCVSFGPHDVLSEISPTKILPNGTLYTSKGSDLSYKCNSNSHPAPNLKYWLYRINTSPELFHSVEREPFLNFTLKNVVTDYQGNYSCSAENPLTGQNKSSTLELLVYYPPSSPITCQVNNSMDFSELLLSCSWSGGYPNPSLQWKQNGKLISNNSSERNSMDTLVVSVNRTQLSAKQIFQCSGNHLISEDKGLKTCHLQIDFPLLETQPMRTCFSGENVTLSCSVSGANPPAIVTWLHNLSNPNYIILPGKKYHISQNGFISYLTILNCTHEEDEGYYMCKAENVLGIREINIWLTVNKPHNILGMVTVLVILFLLVVAIITATVLYCDPQVYLKANPFRSKATDVLVLVESEEEENDEMFDSVERIQDTAISDPPSGNGHISKHQVIFRHPHESPSDESFSKFSEDNVEEN
ncbi:hypothetical protein GDO86_002101 [Hymenochirus boettgeri]|uniref:Ig-like domain-containing protein n=1 Tax=Hymenochirus boettgeri TaxID=247094 RepID=A0A8T2KP71_9PIPI|nr:hypothetical protein GDO86_002101 [Hymenochirus boettgeri]